MSYGDYVEQLTYLLFRPDGGNRFFYTGDITKRTKPIRAKSFLFFLVRRPESKSSCKTSRTFSNAMLSGSSGLTFSLVVCIKFDTMGGHGNREAITSEVFSTGQRERTLREWLKDLPPEERKIIGEDIKTVQWGWPLGMPLVRPLGEGIFEVRSKLANRIARVIFCTNGPQIILLHGFIKKTQAIADDDMRLARKRKAEIDGN